ncbi:MAG: hypothetical protein ACTHOB_06685 [Ginsengibacter sp.]
MKKFKLPLITLLSAVLLTIGCKKDLRNPVLTSDATYSSDTTGGFILLMDVTDVTGTPQADPNCGQNSIQVKAYEWFKNRHVSPTVSAKDRISITIISNETGAVVQSYAPDADANTTPLQTYCLPNGCYTIKAHFSHSASSTSVVNYDVSASLCFGVDALCTYSQGYWFANNTQHPNGVHAWPNDITIGGYSYSNADGIAIWNTSNAGGIPDAKKAFTQLAAIYLSGVDISTTTIGGDVATIEAWLTSLGQKLSPTYLPMESDIDVATYGDVRTAADNISNYINAHECAGSGD